MSLLTSDDLHLFNEGTHIRLYDKLGAHPTELRGEQGCHFAVWSPNSDQIYVRGDFNDWSPTASPLNARQSSGIWEGFIPGAKVGDRYKYHLISRGGADTGDKSDPFAFHAEIAPKTASIVSKLDYEWSDEQWLIERRHRNAMDAPISVYEMHLGSWMRPSEDENEFFSYRELAPKLVEYIHQTGFTHVEFLPVMEHPFFGSWGYQIAGYFAPSSRYGEPQDLMYLIDYLHRCGIGVILDWVPSHFVTDAHGLGRFDGTHLYEHADPKQGRHPDWDSYIFNYGRKEIQSFLVSNAVYWLDKFHVDGLRVDAVASMLYLDYSRKEGDWVPNQYGGNENVEAIEFLRYFNSTVYREYPDVITIAEESTSWPMVSRPAYVGGLGFGYKWDMGWMHDTLSYMSMDPVFRKYEHNKTTFRMMYAFSENFMLTLSHDEVVHGKRSLIEKMPGDEWSKFANLRLLFGYMFAQPGKKLLFMGGEFGQRREWRHAGQLDWELLSTPPHADLLKWVSDLNRIYQSEAALHDLDCQAEGFRWIDCHDGDRSVLSFLRVSNQGEMIIVVCNYTPVVRENYRVGAPRAGRWDEILNSDAAFYGGRGLGNMGGADTAPVPFHGHSHSLNLTLPGLSVLLFKHQPRSNSASNERV